MSGASDVTRDADGKRVGADLLTGGDATKGEQMTIRTPGGWALLINVFLTLVMLIGLTTSIGGDNVFAIIGLALGPLLIVGLMAIWTMLPHTGRPGLLGLVGLWLLGLAAGIAFAVRLTLLVSAFDAGEIIPLSSAVLGLVGSVLLGWVTIQSRAFHPAIGWLLIVGGVLNLVGGLIPGGAIAFVVVVVTMLAQAGALGGYGWTMLQRSNSDTRATIGAVAPGE